MKKALFLLAIVALLAGCGTRNSKSLDAQLQELNRLSLEKASPVPIVTPKVKQSETQAPTLSLTTPNVGNDGKNTDGSKEGLSVIQTDKADDSKPITLSELRRKYPTRIIFSGPKKKEVALTFDDAPDDQFTPQILEVLAKYNVEATFFVVGERAEKYPSMLRRIAREGHVIGNHSYSHANLVKLSDAAFRNEIKRTDNAISRVIGYTPKLVRTPYGNIREKQLLWLSRQNHLVVNWNVDSQDWKGLNADQVYDNIMGAVKPGAIILQHSGGGEGEDLSGTVQALPRIITQLRTQGYRIVTLPELLNVSKKK